MTQEERWQARYQEVVVFIESNHRNPSKYNSEERLMVHFLKRNRKLINAGELSPERVELFNKLQSLNEQYKHVNQWV